MKILIPSSYILLETNVPISEAPVFSNRNYATGEITAYGNYLYQKLSTDEVFDVFNNRKYYIEGDYVTDSSINYVCILSTNKENPAIDTSHWLPISTTLWENSTSYAVGQVVEFETKNYLCIKAHTRSPEGIYKAWVSGQNSSYYNGRCTYNGRYYKNSSVFDSYSLPSLIPPGSKDSSIYAIPISYFSDYLWQDITNIAYEPSSSSEFWQEITTVSWSDKLFFGVNDITIYNGDIYKCILEITNDIPLSDTTHWQNISNKIPSSSESWKKLSTLNRFKMFDQFLNTITTVNSNIEFSISAIGINSLYLGNIYADSIEIEIIDANTSSIIETYTENFFNSLSDWQDYFYGDWIQQRKTSFLYERTSLTTNIILNIKLIGSICSCGIFLIGKSNFIGNTQWEVTDESLDYSTIVTDTSTGETYLSQGNEVPILQVDLFVNTYAYDGIKKKLNDARGLPVLFYDAIDTTRVYGFIQKRSTLLSSPVKTVITLNIQGLI